MMIQKGDLNNFLDSGELSAVKMENDKCLAWQAMPLGKVKKEQCTSETKQDIWSNQNYFLFL